MHKPAQVELQLDRPQLPYSEILGPITVGGSPARYRRRQPNPTRKGPHIYLYIYISLSSLITNTILDCYSVFLLISRSPTLRVFLPLYNIFPFHDLHLPHADQIVGVDLCPISTFLKSLSSNYKAKSYCSGITSSSMRSES